MKSLKLLPAAAALATVASLSVLAGSAAAAPAMAPGTIATSGRKARTAISRSSFTGEANSRRLGLLLSRSLPRAA